MFTGSLAGCWEGPALAREQLRLTYTERLRWIGRAGSICFRNSFGLAHVDWGQEVEAALGQVEAGAEPDVEAHGA